MSSYKDVIEFIRFLKGEKKGALGKVIEFFDNEACQDLYEFYNS